MLAGNDNTHESLDELGPQNHGSSSSLLPAVSIDER